MPYASNGDLPEGVRNVLPAAAQSIWRNVFNSAAAGGAAEESSIKQAWGAVKNAGYEKDEDTGKWRKVEKRRTFRPPQAVLNNARRGAELQKRWGRGESPDLADLVEGGAIPLEDVLLMKAFFDDRRGTFRPDSPEEDGGPGARTVEWLLWGGTAGSQWTDRVLKAVAGERRAGPGEPELASGAITKVDDALGLVLGYAIICKRDGEPYFDLQGDHIPEEAMLAAATDFMLGARVAGDMHRDGEHGTVVFAWPMTAEIAKAFGLETKTTGLMIAIKPDDPEILEKFRQGDYTGFSIAGARLQQEVVHD